MSNSPAKTLLVAIGALFVVLLAWNLLSTSQPAYVTAAKTYFTNLSENKTSTLYSLECAEHQQKVKPDEYAATQKKNWDEQTEGLGELEKLSLNGTSHTGDRAIVELKFQFENDTKTAQALMKKEADGWRVCGGGFTSGSGLPGATTVTTSVSVATTAAKP